MPLLVMVQLHFETHDLTLCDHAAQFDPTSAGTGSNYRWWDEGELRELSETVGLVDFQRTRRMRFIMFSVKKPMLSSRNSD